MRIIKKDFPSILSDNELAYFSLIEGIINAVDDSSVMEVRKNPNSYHFRVSPSMSYLINSLIEEINKLHSLLQIRVQYGKSLKNSGVLTYFIDINN